jgi:hypothetical protein
MPLSRWFRRSARKAQPIRRRVLELERVEDRTMPSTISWGLTGGGNWDVGANWQGGQVPGSGDTVVINTTAAAVITIQSSDAITVQSVSTASPDTLSFTGGSLTLTAGTSTLSGPLAQTGGTVAVQGPGTLTVSTSATLDHATIIASSGAAVSLPAGPAYTGSTTLVATGAGTTLTLATTAMNEPTTAGTVLLLEAQNGGQVSLPALTAVTGGPVVLWSDGAHSVINLPQLQTFTASGGGTATNGGAIQTTPTLPAAPDLWINPGDGQWDDPNSWLFGDVPADTDNVLIDTSTPVTVTVMFLHTSVQSITVGSNDTLVLNGECMLSTAGDFANDGTLDLQGVSELAVGRKATEAPAATLNEQLLDTVSGYSSEMAVAGQLTLAGTFNVSVPSPFNPPPVGTDLPVLTFTSVTGSFAAVTGLSQSGMTLSLVTKAHSIDLLVASPGGTPPTFTADTPPAAGVGDAYRYQFQAAGTTPITYGATGLPGWATLNPNTGVLSGTPPTAGTVRFQVTASNGIAPAATANIALVAQLDPPVFIAFTPPDGAPDVTYSYQFQATGTGTHPITYSATGLPGWATLDPSTGILSGTPPDGAYDFQVTASNGIAAGTTVAISIQIAGGNAMTFNVADGTTFTVPYGVYIGGTTFNVGAGATVDLGDGTFTGGAVFNLAAGAFAYIGTGFFSSISGTLRGTGAGTVMLTAGDLRVGVGGLTLDFPGAMFQWTDAELNAGKGDVTNLGTVNISGDSDRTFAFGTFDNFGTVIQAGTGDLQLYTDGSFPATFQNEAGASYLLEGDSGLTEIATSDSAYGQSSLVNAGLIRKTAGTGTSTIGLPDHFVSSAAFGTIDNTGTIEADSGTLALTRTTGINQLSGGNLTGGTWVAAGGATLAFPEGTSITASAANVTLSGSGVSITGLAGLASSSGSLTLTGGASFTTAGDFTNSGSLTIGAGSTIFVVGNEVETATSRLSIEIGGAPASGAFGVLQVGGTASLAGTFAVMPENNFIAAANQDFKILTYTSASGSFSAFLGFGSTFTESLNPTSLNLYAFLNPADLQVTDVSTNQVTALVGQTITVHWQVLDQGPAGASGSWQDSVFLSPTSIISSASILLRTVGHHGGLIANNSYFGVLSAAIPAIIPGDYYILVQDDSLYQVPDANRSNNTLAAAAQVQVSIPILAMGTAYGDAFTGNDEDRYYQVNASAGSSMILAVSGAPDSEVNAVYATFDSLPSMSRSDFGSSASTVANPSLAVPFTQSGTYYILVHNVTGDPGNFNITASLSGLRLQGASPATVGNAGMVTLAVNALGLDPSATYALSGPGGTITALASEYQNAALAYVTFDMTAVQAGTYDLSIMLHDGTSATLPGGIQVTSGGGADVVASLIGNSPVRLGRTSMIYVRYANTGTNDAPAPLLRLTTKSAILMGLTPNVTLQATSLEFLAISQAGPANILRPGTSFQVPVYFVPTGGGGYTLTLGVNDTSDTDTLDWNDVLGAVSPDVSGAVNWPTVYAELQQSVGGTWGRYIAMLNRNAALLPTSVGDPSDPADLLQPEIARAIAAVSTSLTGKVVATGPGVFLAGDTITATNTSTGDTFSATLFNDGSFVIPTVTPGSYTFTVAHDLVDGSTAPVNVTAGQAVTGIVVTIDPEATISGIVTDGTTGAPIAGASVLIMAGLNQMVGSATTDVSGVYECVVAPGNYTVIAASPGLSRADLPVTLSAGPTRFDVALAADTAVTGTVSPTDGQTVQNLSVVASLHGDPLPFFTNTYTNASFLLDSLAPGVYDFDIFAPGYNAAILTNVTIAAGQTVDLGTVTLTPPDPDDPALAAQKAADQALIDFYGQQHDFGPQFQQIVDQYFNGLGTSKDPFNPSGQANPSVQLTGKDAETFQNAPQTAQALEATLAVIGQNIQNYPAVQEAMQKLQNCYSQPITIALAVPGLMANLGLSQWQKVTPDSPPTAKYLWQYQDGSEAAFLAGGVGHGGPPPPNATPSNDTRTIDGIVYVEIQPDGSGTLTGDFDVKIHDTFDFNTLVDGGAGLGPLFNPGLVQYVKNGGNQEFNPANLNVGSIAVLAAVLHLSSLESLGLTADVPFDVEFKTNVGPVQFQLKINVCKQPNPQQSTNLHGNVLSAKDPNTLAGPIGLGTQGFVESTATLPYTIDFANDGTAPAQIVTLTEQLDPNLNWSTFQLGSFGFGPLTIAVPAGLTQYETTVFYKNSDGSALNVSVSLDLNVQTGLFSARFTSLNPATGAAPDGVYDGFLPVNDSGHVGEGFVQYTIEPKAQLGTGTVIEQQASVVFDTNDPLATNAYANTVAAVADRTTLTETAGTIRPVVAKISTLLGNHYSDPDGSKHTKPGIAVLGTTGDGVWQYSRNGKSWQTVLANSGALLLPQADQIRFVPTGLVTGDASLLYVAWDGSLGSAGQAVALNGFGGGTPFSATAGKVALTVTAVMQAPLWLATSTTLAPVLPGSSSPAGQTIADAFGAVFSGDNGQSAGVAITGKSAAKSGTWQYRVYNSLTQSYGPWTPLPAVVSASKAVLLGPLDMIAFVPSTGFAGVASLQIHAWDGSGTGTVGQVVNLGKTGGVSPYSSAALTAVLHVNTAPTQSSAGITLTPALPENKTSAAISVKSLLTSAHAADADKGASLGLALTGVSGPGTWQYKLASTWLAVPANLSGTQAVLLPPSAQLRFVPTPNVVGTASLTWLAWDQTQGSAGLLVDTTVSGGASPFSTTGVTAALAMIAGSPRAAWIAGTPLFTPVAPNNNNPPGNQVQQVFGPFFQEPGTPVGIAISAVSGSASGTWQYSHDGINWLPVLPVSVRTPLKLAASDYLRFVPKPNFLGSVTLTAYAWDGTTLSATPLVATCLVNTSPSLTA